MHHSPFKFLEAYSAQDKHLFFGRDQEIETLFNITFRSRFILVYGPSGTGKTSLIRSGLAKRLSDTDWFSLYIRRKQDINAALREELSKWDKRPNTKQMTPPSGAGGALGAGEVHFAALSPSCLSAF